MSFSDTNRTRTGAAPSRPGRAPAMNPNDRRQDFNREEGRETFAVVCASCGNRANVPFKPRNGRPVYCDQCYRSRRPTSQPAASPRRPVLGTDIGFELGRGRGGYRLGVLPAWRQESRGNGLGGRDRGQTGSQDPNRRSPNEREVRWA